MCHVLFNNILIWSEQVQNEGVTWHLKNTTRASTQLISRSCNLVIHILVRLCLYYQKLKHVMQIYSCIYLYALGHALIKQTMYTNIDFIFCFNFFFSLNQKKKNFKGVQTATLQFTHKYPQKYKTRWRRCWHDCVLFGKQTRSSVRSPIFHQTKTLSIIVFLSLSTDILTSYSPYAQTAMHVLEGANRENPGPITIAKSLSLPQSSFLYYGNNALWETHRKKPCMSYKNEGLFVIFFI